jgi:rhodanese-related sulfurtransferase
MHGTVSPRRTLADLLAEAEAVVPRLDPVEAAAWIEATGALVVDVREAPELEGGMIAGAVHVSRGMLEFCADPASDFHLPAFRFDRAVLLYCGIGERSALAGRTLREMGYPRVASLDSFDGWLRARLPVASPPIGDPEPQ